MKRLRISIRSIFAVGLVGMMLMTSAPALAGNNFLDDVPMYKSHWEYYGVGRSVSYSPWEVAFNKTDGPGLWMKIYGCGNSSGAGEGPEIYFEDLDPPYGYQYLRAGKTWGISFCLAALSNGSYSMDTFDGNVDWDG